MPRKRIKKKTSKKIGKKTESEKEIREINK